MVIVMGRKNPQNLNGTSGGKSKVCFIVLAPRSTKKESQSKVYSWKTSNICGTGSAKLKVDQWKTSNPCETGRRKLKVA